jgi:hypothetical protein
MMIRRAIVTLVPMFLMAAGGCARDAEGTLAMERKTVGDTLFVHVVSGSVWDTTARLVEELRIGKLDGPPEEMFGQVLDVAPDGHGGVYLFDGQVPALRHFDSTGRHVALLGGKGAGPGEYQDASLGLDVRPDGRVFLRDPRNGRINIYTADGKPSGQVPVSSGLFTANAMVIDTAGDIYLKVLLGPIERNKAWPIGLLHLAPDGRIIDSLRTPTIAGQPDVDGGRFDTRKVWEPSPLGYIVAGVNSAYRFEFRKPDGKVVRIEKDYSPLAVGPEERKELEAVNEWTRVNRARFLSAEIPPVPETKPPFNGFDIGSDGQIWVRVATPAVKLPLEDVPAARNANLPPPTTWREPSTYDVFEPDGTFLGRIRLPDGVSLMAHRGTEVWGMVSGESGELHIVRYRLQAAGGG